MPIPPWASRAFWFLVEYISTAGLDTGRRAVSARLHRPEDLETQVYRVLTDSLRKFCALHSLEFDEKAMVETFIFSLHTLPSWKNEARLRSILENALGMKVDRAALREWMGLLAELIVAPENETLFKALQLSPFWEAAFPQEKPWMKACLAGNFFEIDYTGQEMFRDLCGEIETELSDACWLCARQLLMELLLKAQLHGHAARCVLRFEEDRILLEDDGLPFDPTSLAQLEGIRGGQWTLRRFIRDFPEVNISYANTGGCNRITLSYGQRVFCVNGLCEIPVPTFFQPGMTLHTRYPTGRARNYFMDFEKSGASLFCMSGVHLLLESIAAFCSTSGAQIFLYIPHTGEVWADDLAEMLGVLLPPDAASSPIHIIRDP